MILQSDNPVRMVRELKGAPLSILFLLGFVKQPVSQEWLERNSGYTDKPVSQALQYLQEHGLVMHSSGGWIASSNAQQLVMGLEIEEENEEENNPVTDLPDQHQEQSVLSRNNSDSVNYLSKEVVVDINNINNSTTDSLNLTPQDGKIPTLEEIQKVLDAGEKLFGRPIMGDPRDYADIDRLISWIAQAYRGSYDQGVLKIKNPAGLVYWAFHQGKDRHAEKKYIENPEQYLPESFMDDSGQWEFADEEKLYA